MIQNLTPKIKILSAIIICLTVAIAFSLQSPEKKSTLSENFSFAIEQPEQIDKIVFGKIVLEKKGAKNWVLNQNTPADLPTVQELLQILQKIEVKRPVSESMQPTARQLIQEQGIDIQVYSNSELIQQFRIAGEENNSFALSPEGEAMLVYVPTMEIVLHQVFRMPESDWRDRTIIAVNWLGIKQLSIQYTDQSEHNFVLKASDNFYTVEGISRLDSGLVYNYLQAYQNVRAYLYFNDTKVQDSISKQKTICTISIQAIADSDSETLKVWGNKNLMLGYLENKKQWVQLQPRSFARLFLRKKDFEYKAQQ